MECTFYTVQYTLQWMYSKLYWNVHIVQETLKLTTTLTVHTYSAKLTTNPKRHTGNVVVVLPLFYLIVRWCNMNLKYLFPLINFEDLFFYQKYNLFHSDIWQDDDIWKDAGVEDIKSANCNREIREYIINLPSLILTL